MSQFTQQELYQFIVEAKENSYVARAPRCLPSRLGSHDIQYQNGHFQYLDSYFGGQDFLGQEVVYFDGKPIWAMNYYGKILQPDCYDAEKAGNTVLASLRKLYQLGHFLGDSVNETEWGTYHDNNQGDVYSFTGYEWIELLQQKVYELHYHGGLIKP
ncbi:hypothetical protein H2O73_16740 [Vibrio sp. 404]|uniref:DUF5680 domain-containing protein n=1 Tax=Vibrio marinisediminis TaxID=2758441 RepID=A0A7W2FTS6_9VIBR|nr:DUF5680 domain-containing protein [Vibrio marinisediminis]MBA5764014.1 hypothetical protein [Vibrio marinisediminis]